MSNMDSLTGIANRRCFDATLEHEYSRLRRSNSKL
ncbi:MAG TPA: diguanylate cyclase [Clostridiales bacterium]|nr:diguanylate cyclase [Clostridiales bacterium]